jgi:hypothetical protein
MYVGQDPTGQQWPIQDDLFTALANSPAFWVIAALFVVASIALLVLDVRRIRRDNAAFVVQLRAGLLGEVDSEPVPELDVDRLIEEARARRERAS